MSKLAIRTQVPKQTMPNRVGLHQYIYNINFNLYIIKNWLEIAEIAIKPRTTQPNQGEPNQTKPDQNQTKPNQTKPNQTKPNKVFQN